MSTDNLVTKSDLHDFYNRILPYLGGSADAGFTPVGTVISVMGKTAPANYLPCDGSVYNIADYPELANYFLQQFESVNYFGGDGTTTFAVPDLRGEFLRGTGTNSHTNSILGKAEGSGSDVGIHQQATSHRFYQVEFTNGVFGFTNNSGNAGDYDGQKISGKMKYSTTFTNQTPDPPTGGNYPCYYTARPTNTSVLFCIATKNIYLNPSLDFSTSEKVVGTWINGKPLYQKTITGTTGSSSNPDIYTSIGASIDKVVYIKAMLLDSEYNQWTSLPREYYNSGGLLQNFAVVKNSQDNSHPNSLRVYVQTHYESEFIATLQYTKTTD